MVSYHSLLHADLQPLKEAAQKWHKVPGNYREVRGTFSREVEKGLWKSDMEGATADAVFKALGRVGRQIDEAVEEAEDTWHFLHSAHTSLKKWHDKLKARVKEIGEDKNLEIDSKGTVHYKPKNLDDLEPDEIGPQNKRYHEIVDAHNNYISWVLDSATAADETLHWALSNDHNGRAKGFDGDGVTSMSDANQARKQARKDADALVRLASSYEGSEKPSAETIRKMAEKMARHEGDPYFAERLATRLNARGTLEWWERCTWTLKNKPDKERFSAVRDFQKSLSFTLATASHTDSPAMEKWKKDVIRLGPERFASTYGNNPHDVRGFQLMSSLMRSGSWDKDFLHDYGKGFTEGKGSDKRHVPGLIDYDKRHPDPQALWQGRPPFEYDHLLNYGSGGDQGMDPMTGYMEALGHNPEAAQEVFRSEKNPDGTFEKNPDGTYRLNPDLDYLLRKREWPTGGPDLPGDRDRGYDELGHALEAAALGHPWDAPEKGLHRTADSANVMQQVVTSVAEHPGIVGDRPGIENSMAKMGAGYIDDLNRGVSNFGDREGGQDLRDAAFGNRGEGHMKVIPNMDAMAFLREVGGKPGAYEILSAAQDQYVLSAMKAHPKPDRELGLLLETGAKSQGVLDHARADAVQAGANDKSTDLRADLTAAAAWKKYAVGQGLGAFKGTLELPLGIEGVPKAAAFGIPLVTGAGSGALETHVNNEIDRQVLEQWKEESRKFTESAIKTKDDFLDISQHRIMNWLEIYRNSHGIDDASPWYDKHSFRMETQYNGGDTQGDQGDGD
ncbi:hypothetical protein FM076_16385 [Streptomyces albus subsp. chlorinus]|uniref:DUF6571 family protein n=1 Tax=Streptomyces albus TaxID=1888 RepID=UPI00156DF077|nr:hypothetical protein [Streptomyces albus]NSC22664.1 hypothetical protein [Streptomyces albus subsp. chlorinus]